MEALSALAANGHGAWLCTGRSRAFVPGYLEQIPFTGMISACGATIEKDGVRLFNKEMPPEVARHSVEVLRRYGLVPVMEGADYMYYDKEEYNSSVNWYCDLITEALGPKWKPIRGNEDCMRINKISAKMLEGCDAAAACRNYLCITISSAMRAAPLREQPSRWYRRGAVKQWGLQRFAGFLTFHGKIPLYSGTATMIFLCLNMRRRKLLWETAPKGSKSLRTM